MDFDINKDNYLKIDENFDILNCNADLSDLEKIIQVSKSKNVWIFVIIYGKWSYSSKINEKNINYVAKTLNEKYQIQVVFLELKYRYYL